MYNINLKTLFCNTILLLIIINVSLINGEEYDVNGFCTILPDNTKIASIESCQKYYVCRNGQAIEAKCSSNDLSFDKNTQSCKPSRQVQCAGSSPAGGQGSCAGILQGFVAVPNSCSDYIYCENGVEFGRAKCPNGMTFNKDRCDYTPCTESGIESPLTSSCDVIPNNIFFGSTMDCSEYHICIDNKFQRGRCSNDWVFNIQQQSCSWSSSGAYCEHVTENELLPGTETKYPTCTKQGEKSSSSSDCSAYYICTNSNKKKMNCPNNQFFDDYYLICKDRQMAKPNENCDRCLGSKESFVNAVDESCKKYLGCVKGKKSYTGFCPDNTYFDEDVQACVPSKSLATYASVHGACRTLVPPTPKTESTTKATTTTTTPKSTTLKDTTTTTTKTTTPDPTTPSTTEETTTKRNFLNN